MPTLNFSRFTMISNHKIWEGVHLRKDGTSFPVEVSLKIVQFERDYLISVVRDITERKHAQEAIFGAAQKMDAFFDQSLDGFFFMMLDEPIEWNDQADKNQLLEYVFSNQRITKINHAMLDQYGATTDQFIGITPNEMFRHDVEQGKNEWRKLFDQGKLHNETDERKLSGEQIFVEGDYICLYDSEGRITGHFGIQRDVTQGKRMVHAIVESERKYHYLFENNPAPMWIYDLDTFSFLEVNRAAVDHYGYSHQEFLKMTIKDIRPLDDIVRLLTDVESTQQILNHAGTWRHRKKNGAIIYVDITSHLIDFEEKQARLVISTDISDRINAQLDLEAEKKLLRTLIDNLPDPIYVKDREGRKMLANMADVQNIGCASEADTLGKTDLELFGNAIGKRGYDEDLRIMENGQAMLNREEIFTKSDGFHRWLLTSKVPLFDQYGKTIGLVGIGRDITGIKKAEEQINKLTKSIEQSPSTIIITDTKGNIEYVNPKFSEITGYTKEEVIGKNPRILKSGEMPAAVYLQLWEAITSGEVWRGEFLNRKKNGALYWEWATMTSIRNEAGEITNYIAIKEDISLRKQMEADLIVSKEKAEESDRLKSAFLANMSHEIRTPLNSIIGFSELLADKTFNTDQKDDFIHHIIANGNNRLAIISDIMDISKMESGELKIHKDQINVIELISKIRSQYAIQIEGKEIEFKVDIPDNMSEIEILADEDRLMQVFNNLLSNALKFTSQGSVQIDFQIQCRMVEFCVSDTGIGIPDEFHAKIFDRFRQVEDSSTRKFGGNGLGLAITKNLIELMGGEIRLESQLGKGAAFYFTIPLIKY